MRKLSVLLFAVLAIAAALMLGLRRDAVQAQGKEGAGFASVPGTKGGQDMFGPYDVVKGWPKDISTLPGNEKWT